MRLAAWPCGRCDAAGLVGARLRCGRETESADGRVWSTKAGHGAPCSNGSEAAGVSPAADRGGGHSSRAIEEQPGDRAAIPARPSDKDCPRRSIAARCCLTVGTDPGWVPNVGGHVKRRDVPQPEPSRLAPPEELPDGPARTPPASSRSRSAPRRTPGTSPPPPAPRRQSPAAGRSPVPFRMSRLRNSWGWRLGAVLNSPGKHPFALDRRLDAGSGGPAARREVEVGLFRRVADRASEHRWVTDAGRAPRGVAGGALVMSPGVRAGRR